MGEMDVTLNDPASLNWAAFSDARSRDHADYVVRAAKYNGFYCGDQWDPALKKELEGAGRPALTLNEIQGVINSILGHYSKTRADIRYKPRRAGATAETAHILSRLCDAVLDLNNYSTYLEPRMFEDGIIEDRGYLDVRCEFDENPMGEVKIRVLNPREVLPDVDATDYDPSTWRRVQTAKWMTLDEIEAQYGKKGRRSVESLAVTPSETFGELSVRYQGFGGDTGTPAGGTPHPQMVRSVRVIDHQYRRMTRVRELLDPDTGRTRIIPDHWSNDRVERVAEDHGLVVRTRVRSRIRWTVSADHVTLFDGWSPYSDFTVVPFFPIYRRGRPSGLVRVMVDPQEQLNKVESQILHTINTTANSGWMVESGSMVNMSEEDLERKGAKSGLVIVYGRNRAKPEKIQPNQIPSGLDQAASKANNAVRRLSGAEALLGEQPKTNVSGVALDRAQQHALVGLQPIFNNLNFTRGLVARRVLDCVQTFYTEHRVFQITDWRDPEAHEEELEINVQATDEIVNNISVGVYDVKASSVPTQETWQDMQFAHALEMRREGVAIPDHYIILNSPLAGKEKIAAEVKQMQGLGEPDEIQLMLAQLGVAKAEAEVAEIQARVSEFETRAQHNLARAHTEIAGEERQQMDTMAKYRMELQRLQADLEKKRQDLEAKLQIAQIHADTKSGLTRYQAMSRAAENQRDRDSRAQQENMRAHKDLLQEAMRAASSSGARGDVATLDA